MTKPRLVLATHNRHKVAELRAILAPLLPKFDPASLVCAADLAVSDPIEDGASFSANALIKARASAQATGLPALADDSGISVDIMGGAPGIFSARWCGKHGDDAANLELLLAQLHDVPEQNRTGAFVCAAALVTPDGQEYVHVAQLRGTILTAAWGQGGFGYDPIFRPDGYEVTTAQLSAQEKNAISHRAAAFTQLASQIGKVLTE